MQQNIPQAKMSRIPEYGALCKGRIFGRIRSTDLGLYDHNTFNSFLYVLALRAAKELCKIMDELDLLKEVSAALEVANYRISEELWSEEDGYYHAWWDKEKGSPSWLMSDSLYAQVWAYTLGLGHLDDPKRLGCNFRPQDNFLLPGFEFFFFFFLINFYCFYKHNADLLT